MDRRWRSSPDGLHVALRDAEDTVPFWAQLRIGGPFQSRDRRRPRANGGLGSICTPIGCRGRFGAMDDVIINAIERGGYAGIFLLMALENIIPPIPSEVIMGIGGVLVARGAMDFWPLLLAGTAGSTAGNLVLFWLGQRYGYKRLQPFVERWGRWLTVEWEAYREGEPVPAPAWPLGGVRAALLAGAAFGHFAAGGSCAYAGMEVRRLHLRRCDDMERFAHQGWRMARPLACRIAGHSGLGHPGNCRANGCRLFVATGNLEAGHWIEPSKRRGARKTWTITVKQSLRSHRAGVILRQVTDA